MQLPFLPLAACKDAAAPRPCALRRAGQAHRQPARAEAGHARPGPGARDEGEATNTPHDAAQSAATPGAATMPAVSEPGTRDMTALALQPPMRDKLDELRALASHLTAGSLLQAATLQLIAEQEKAPRRTAPARIAELSPQA